MTLPGPSSRSPLGDQAVSIWRRRSPLSPRFGAGGKELRVLARPLCGQLVSDRGRSVAECEVTHFSFATVSEASAPRGIPNSKQGVAENSLPVPPDRTSPRDGIFPGRGDRPNWLQPLPPPTRKGRKKKRKKTRSHQNDPFGTLNPWFGKANCLTTRRILATLPGFLWEKNEKGVIFVSWVPSTRDIGKTPIRCMIPPPYELLRGIRDQHSDTKHSNTHP